MTPLRGHLHCFRFDEFVVYIVRFGTMKGMFHASRWAEVGHIYSTGMTNADYIFLGSKRGEDLYLVERLGFTCHTYHLDSMVR